MEWYFNIFQLNKGVFYIKFKIEVFNKKLLKDYLAWLSTISLILSFVFIVIDIPDKYKTCIGLILLVTLISLYIILWLRANLLSKVKLKINNSTVIVKVGDIFKEDDFKVIAFNEYFDTEVDNRIISEKTLNGIYIKELVENVDKLDDLISNDAHLEDRIVDRNNDRTCGKREMYELGTIFQHDDYLLTAFAKFDDDNRAYLDIKDYINFLLNFWNEIDIIYAGCSVSIPLLGSGITRFKGYDTISEQELLELLIWSFKISRIKFTYPSKVSIIIHESKKDKINFYKLKEC